MIKGKDYEDMEIFYGVSREICRSLFALGINLYIIFIDLLIILCLIFIFILFGTWNVPLFCPVRAKYD